MRYIPYGHQSIDEQDIKSVIRVLESEWLTQGPKIKEFEDALCRYTGARYAVAVSSGTAALHTAALAAGIKKGDEVITSPITFIASANCVLYCGGRPVFADVQADTVNIDPEEIKKKITRKTKALIPVHFAGHPCDLEEISRIAQQHKLLVVEDAAHALGAEYKGSKIGSCKYSDMTTFSFHPVKSITTGEGGAVLTNRKDLYKKLIVLRNHGITKETSQFCGIRRVVRNAGPWYYEMQTLGYNYRITDIQCALGISQLKKIDTFIKRRREIAKVYGNQLSSIESIQLPGEKTEVFSSWHLYPIRIKRRGRKARHRKKIVEEFRTQKIGVQIHYIPVYFQPYYRKLGYTGTLCPCAEEYYEEVLSLPLYVGMSNSDVKTVVCLTRKIMEKY